MAITTHTDGERLIETKKRARANFIGLIADGSYTATDYKLDMVGKSLIPFREICEYNLAQFAAELDVVGVRAQGLLTLDVVPLADDTITIGANTYTFKAGNTAERAAGELTLAVQPIAGDTFTIDTTTFTLVATGREPTYESSIEISLGTDLSGTQTNIKTKLDLTMTTGPWATNKLPIEAPVTGTAGNAIVTTETFTSGSNVFDAATLGTVSAGAQLAEGQIGIGPTLADSQANLLAAIALTDVVNAGLTVVVSMSAFASDISTITADDAGTAGNAIVTTETFTAVTNVFDATTLGTETAGVAEVDTYPTMKPLARGDRIFEIRSDLNFNFALIDAVVNP